MQVYIINLAQSTDRLAQQAKQFARLGLTFERLPAVTVDEISPQIYQKHLTSWQRLLKQTEFACLFSHKKAWEKVIEQNAPCVILEDDAVINHDFATLLTHIQSQQFTDVDLINLEVHGRKKIVGKPMADFAHLDYRLLPLLMDKSGAAGYILYPSGAKKLLEYFNNGNIALADALIYDCPNLTKYQIEPAVILQSDKCHLYGVPFDDYQLKSMIGEIKNQISIDLTTTQKATLKKNRIIGQIALGVQTITALMQGTKREIVVNSSSFISNTK